MAVIATAKFEPRSLSNGQRGLGGNRLSVRMITDSIYPQLI
jgi:hypothetical protein